MTNLLIPTIGFLLIILFFLLYYLKERKIYKCKCGGEIIIEIHSFGKYLHCTCCTHCLNGDELEKDDFLVNSFLRTWDFECIDLNKEF